MVFFNRETGKRGFPVFDIFNGLPPLKKAANPFAANRLPKNRVFQQPAKRADCPLNTQFSLNMRHRAAHSLTRFATTQENPNMNQYQFDDSRIAWNALEGFDHLWYSILAIDESRQIVDVLFKFAANQQIVLHRHKALNVMLVIQGEHRLYKPNGDILEVRPAGKFTVSPASDEPHREGGGTEQDVIVYFSIRGSDGVLYEILDDSQNTVGALTMADFVMLYQQQPPLQA